MKLSTIASTTATFAGWPKQGGHGPVVVDSRPHTRAPWWPKLGGHGPAIQPTLTETTGDSTVTTSAPWPKLGGHGPAVPAIPSSSTEPVPVLDPAAIALASWPKLGGHGPVVPPTSTETIGDSTVTTSVPWPKLGGHGPVVPAVPSPSPSTEPVPVLDPAAVALAAWSKLGGHGPAVPTPSTASELTLSPWPKQGGHGPVHPSFQYTTKTTTLTTTDSNGIPATAVETFTVMTNGVTRPTADAEVTFDAEPLLQGHTNIHERKVTTEPTSSDGITITVTATVTATATATVTADETETETVFVTPSLITPEAE
ncbi:hypothetical protein F4780DRAFT_784890 [Xylariomycetidae sp. FL0641]|nr:hypothetical protein F4780DRAFT_784890 [Xylariomycetidae sp. FL0641]